MPGVILNDAAVELPDDPVNLLDWLRAAGLTAAKPGCRGGDCGACQVLLGEVPPEGGAPVYRAVNSCLIDTLLVADCHVITVEGLRRDTRGPVHDALVEEGGIQCGYCTPGLVAALTAGLLAGVDPGEAAAGNLCRCTGYAGIRRACARLAAELPPRPLTLADAARRGLLRDTVAAAGARLALLRPDGVPDGSAPRILVAGETDATLRHPHAATPPGGLRVHRLPAVRGISAVGGSLRIGAGVTVAELRSDPLVSAAWPALAPLLDRFGSPAVRNLATVGGNLVNASPVGDLGVLLLAMGAELTIDGPAGPRTLPLEQFYRGYKDVDLAADELLVAVTVPGAAPTRTLHAEKVGRREHDDIASVSSAMVVDGGAPGRFGAVRLSAGGVAPVPLLLRGASEALSGREISVPVVRGALALLAGETTPITDVRGSAAYKARLLRHLVVAHAATLEPRLDVWGCLG